MAYKIESYYLSNCSVIYIQKTCPLPTISLSPGAMMAPALFAIQEQLKYSSVMANIACSAGRI
jgi:hypothetical protein